MDHSISVDKKEGKSFSLNHSWGENYIAPKRHMIYHPRK